MNWQVTLTYDLALDFDAYNSLADRLDTIDAGLFSLPDGKTAVTYWVVGAADPFAAAQTAAANIGTIMPTNTPVGVEVTDEATFESRANTPTLPELLSAPEVGDLLGGISRQRVHQLRAHPLFPAPLYNLRTGPIWDARAIRKFADEWERKPGRPAKPATTSYVS